MGVRLLLAFALVLLAGPASAARAAKSPTPRQGPRAHLGESRKVGGFLQGGLRWRRARAYRDAPLDHFSWAAPTQTYRQRYFFCPHFWEKKRDALAAAKSYGSAKESPDSEGSPRSARM